MFIKSKEIRKVLANVELYKLREKLKKDFLLFKEAALCYDYSHRRVY